MGKQITERAKITGFIDLTKPHLKKVLHREGENEVVIKEHGHIKGFNTLADAFSRAKEKLENGGQGIRNTSLRGRRARR